MVSSTSGQPVNEQLMTTRPLFSEEQIQESVKKIAIHINEKYKNKKVLAIGILNGAFIFYSELLKHLTIPVVCDFCAISFYGQNLRPKEEAALSLDIFQPIKGRHVLLIDCIADHGYSLKFIQAHIKNRNPQSLYTAILVSKPSAHKVAQIDVSGFTVKQDIFLAGFGIDYKQRGRHFPYLAEVSLN